MPLRSNSPPRSNRRSFLRTATIAGTAISLNAASYSRVYGANSRLRIASVGTGGKGWSDLIGVAASPVVQVVGLCDIDDSAEHLGRAAEKYPEAKRYADWRQLLDQSGDIDGVLVSTPDFMHAPISLAAMQLGKHIFCQKPLAHTVYEVRQMQEAAAKYQLVTQMCNQIQSHTAYRTAVDWVHTGKIGKVKEVHSWQGGSPSWPRNIPRPPGSDPVPPSVRWDLWQGVAAERPYKTGLYHPFNWRGWQAYGTGQLGDFGCHIMDPVFKALRLTSPTRLTAEAPPLMPETWTDRATVRYEFPGTDMTAGSTLKLTWYDAVGARPPREKLGQIPADYELPGAGSVLVGEKGSLVIPHVAMPKLFPEDLYTAAELPTVDSVDHYTQWADACVGNGETTSHFDYAGPLTETVLLGTIGIRFPMQELQWDAKSLEITNHADAQKWITKKYRKGWEPAWV
ncbi:Gfo/Idh/MocA family protein [Allorhodopirellula heiligendammensis]|uniref:Inositol 2-dehydrogenase n=1 Tax=Allorhodopirellula heiligendammensis TaxID=2714739 RepID=A0A5C6BYY6_9BACT|nr:Gfo/Idh/MocA family oxidoreductase [Allorhodopirellula heiligendammensis]TWU16671.1 Inositol 2-dehydrogenase [Allorhodopirellula heiligendammensis]